MCLTGLHSRNVERTRNVGYPATIRSELVPWIGMRRRLDLLIDALHEVYDGPRKGQDPRRVLSQVWKRAEEIDEPTAR